MSPQYLRRYTDLPSLIYMLSNRTITLLDPQTWDDTNDSYYLAQYREKKKLGSVLALCFTQASETYHHWRVFANGSSGVCIRFHRSDLLRAVKKQSNLRTGTTTYLTIAGNKDREIETEDLPFIKRFAFQDEQEFRLVFESYKKNLRALDIPIHLACVSKITLSPWLHYAPYTHLKRTIGLIKGCDNLEIVRSTLIDSDEWKTLGEDAIE